MIRRLSPRLSYAKRDFYHDDLMMVARYFGLRDREAATCRHADYYLSADVMLFAH